MSDHHILPEHRPLIRDSDDQSDVGPPAASLAPFAHHLRSGASAGGQAAAEQTRAPAAADSLSRRLRGSISTSITVPGLRPTSQLAPQDGDGGGRIVCELPDGSERDIDGARDWLVRFWSRSARRLLDEHARGYVETDGTGSLRAIFEHGRGMLATYEDLLRKHLTAQLATMPVLTRSDRDAITAAAVCAMRLECQRILILDDQELF